MWIELAQRLFDVVEPARPASPDDVDAIGTELGHEVPPDLRALLLETDGLHGRHGAALVHPARQIVDDNLALRRDPGLAELYLPFDQLIFFADNGGGDLFGFPALPNRPEVVVWDHETDSRHRVAGSLRDYLIRRAGGDGDDWYRH
ncbi:MULTISPECIES: SMI1/KNR4 family protein [unclassified Pseudonocardia]|uniref:SMI1/KNR4 family protein n=1 Tax=unclassified Pseudonocardia TaxID=2619320 RepID=UPI001CF6B841|nr:MULTISPECIES: SMI1/KNR4 family protein [unclassified Pseudonocardia]